MFSIIKHKYKTVVFSCCSILLQCGTESFASNTNMEDKSQQEITQQVRQENIPNEKKLSRKQRRALRRKQSVQTNDTTSSSLLKRANIEHEEKEIRKKQKKKKQKQNKKLLTTTDGDFQDEQNGVIVEDIARKISSNLNKLDAQAKKEVLDRMKEAVTHSLDSASESYANVIMALYNHMDVEKFEKLLTRLTNTKSLRKEMNKIAQALSRNSDGKAIREMIFAAMRNRNAEAVEQQTSATE